VATNTPDYFRSRVSAFGRDIQAQAGAELRIETIGTSPNQVCVIQWTNYKRYSSNGTGDTINFQIRLSEAGGVETDQTIELVYGKVVFGSSSTTNYVAQVGIGGTLSTDAHNRVTSLPHDWNASSQGLLNTDGCQLPYTGVSVVAPASGLTFSYIPPLPCTGTPAPGNTLTTSDFLCPGAPFTLSLQYTNFGSMITYQWQTSADGILWNDIAGADQALLVYSQSSDSYYRCAVTCTNSNETGYSNPVYIGLVGLPGLPYQEDLESILLNNEYPNCMNSTNLGLYTFTYTADQGSYNRYAHSGSKFASFKYGCSDYFFTPAVELVAGNTYQFSFFYITDGYSGWDTLEARFGGAPDAASMTNTIVTISNPSNTSYLKLEGTFIPPSSGVYYIGIYCSASFAPWYLSIDDLSLVEYGQCMGTPDGGTAVSNLSAVCGGVAFILSLTGQTIASGLTYQWQSSADGNSWSDIPGANQSSLTQSQNSDTYYRCSITCTNSNLTGYSDPVFVEAVGIPAWPYTEDFESISVTNEYPNCMNSTSLGTYTFTYTADQGSYNRYAHGGEKFASFKYGCDDYFFTPGFELVAGNTYQFSFYYITDGYSGWNTLEAKYGTAPDPASMTMTIASVANPTNTEYEKLIGSFTPAVSGTYFIGLYCNSTFVPWYLSFDDLSLVEFPPCTGTPEAGATETDQSEVCSGVPLVLQLSGQSIASGLDYQWQRSVDGNNWNDIAGATSETSTVSQTEDTYYRCKVTCSLSGQSDFSSMILVTTSANLVPPYLEGFESIAQENEYPNCMTSTNL
jgi:hypothetical protein